MRSPEEIVAQRWLEPAEIVGALRAEGWHLVTAEPTGHVDRRNVSFGVLGVCDNSIIKSEQTVSRFLLSRAFNKDGLIETAETLARRAFADRLLELIL